MGGAPQGGDVLPSGHVLWSRDHWRQTRHGRETLADLRLRSQGKCTQSDVFLFHFRVKKRTKKKKEIPHLYFQNWTDGQDRTKHLQFFWRLQVNDEMSVLQLSTLNWNIQIYLLTSTE